MELEFLIKSVLSMSVILVIIRVSFLNGIRSQIISSDFLIKFDNKDELLKKNDEEFKNVKSNLFSTFICIPGIFVVIVLYLLTYKYTYLLPAVTNKSALFIVFIFIIKSIFEGTELYYLYDRSKQTIDENGNIKYDRPKYSIVTISALILLFMFIVLVKTKIAVSLIELLDITNPARTFYYCIITYTTYWGIKKVTRLLVKEDQVLYLKKLKSTNNDTRNYSPIAWSVIFVTLLLAIILIYLYATISISIIPIGEFMVSISFISFFAVLTGQRIEFVRQTRNTYYKNKHFYYKSVDNKEKKLPNGYFNDM
ncbi:hypothetical protein A5881_001290 [Enterococcus termitis]